MEINRLHSTFFRMMTVILLLVVYVGAMYALTPAGTTADRATRVSDETTLSVQSGSNYIRIDADHLPATVTYLPGAPFGPVPEAYVQSELLPVTTVFADCGMGWRWELDKAEKTMLVEIKAHESASVLVEPYVCRTTYSDTTAAVCGGIEWRGTWYEEGGEYSVKLVNAEGCDSVRTLRLTVYNPVNTDTMAEVWDSIAWYGVTHTKSGDYSVEKTDEHECNYTHSLHLTVHYTRYDTVPMKNCDSVLYGEVKYTESGLYLLDTVLLESGDRQINYLDVTVPVSSIFKQDVAQYVPFTSATGTVYETSGDYADTLVNAAGCDSVILTHLTVYTTAYDTVRMDECDSIRFEGKKYTSSVSWNDTVYDAELNRTVRTMEFTIRRTTYKSISVTQYEPYLSEMGNTYSESGVYTEKTVNAAGCDSVITLTVTIATLDIAYDTVWFCAGFNTEHDVQLAADQVRRYRPYAYEEPGEWCMEGVILQIEENRLLADLNRAEQNIYAHYTHGLEPVAAINWSYCPEGAVSYSALEPGSAPQWIQRGVVALKVQFLCGHVFYRELMPDRYEGLTDAVRMSSGGSKVLLDGQMIIIRGGERYNILGVKLN